MQTISSSSSSIKSEIADSNLPGSVNMPLSLGLHSDGTRYSLNTNSLKGDRMELFHFSSIKPSCAMVNRADNENTNRIIVLTSQIYFDDIGHNHRNKMSYSP